MGKQKKVWSQLEDSLLKKIYEQDQMRNWTLIAKKMHQQFNTPKKSGKQCKERYQNHIDASTIKIQWTKQQQNQLIRLHNQIGNKWANIANFIPGKSDNCVKNHFYSKLRKVLRKLNKIIHQYLRKEFRQINITVIYKLVEATQQKFKQSPNCTEQVSLKCRGNLFSNQTIIDIQNRLLSVVLDEDQQNVQEDLESIEFYKDIIKQIYEASKQYKRKSKKSRNMSIKAPNVKKKMKNSVLQQSSKADSQQDQGYMSSDSSNEDGQFSEQDGDNFHKISNPPHTFIVNQQQKPVHVQKKIQVQQGKQRIQNLLRQNNILQNESFQHNYFRFSDKSSFKSFNNSDRQSDKDFFNMFEASDKQGGRRDNSSNYIYFCQRLDDNKNFSSQKQ